jgi:hypothetical protein
VSRLFVGLRVYDRTRAGLQLDATVVGEMLSTLLIEARLRTPGYAEIYIHLADTLEEARRFFMPIPTWKRDAAAVLDLAAYSAGDRESRFRLLVDALEPALMGLAELDRGSIERAFLALRTGGRDMELTGARAESKTHTAALVFRVESHVHADHRLRVTEKASGALREWAVGDGWPRASWPRFRKVELTRKVVRLVSNRQTELEIDLARLFA